MLLRPGYNIAIMYFDIKSIVLLKLQIILGHSNSSDYFEATTNVRNFGKESLCANIGGYVGMILGISFLQVPEMILIILRFLQKEKAKHVHIKKNEGDASEIK